MNDRWTVCLTLPVLILEGHRMTRPLTRSGGFGMGKQFMTGQLCTSPCTNLIP